MSTSKRMDDKYWWKKFIFKLIECQKRDIMPNYAARCASDLPLL